MLARILQVSTMVMAMAILGTANAAVYSPQQQLPSAAIEAFKGEPVQLLQQFPQGGAGLISRVRDLAASDPSTLPSLVALLKTADPKTQIPAIAAGLALVARLAGRSDQAYGNEIQAAIAGSGNDAAIAAYQAAIGDIATAATGGGAGGGSGTGGSTGSGGFAFGGNNNGASTFGGLNYPTLTSNFGTGSVTAATNSTSNIVSSSVSP